MTCSLAATMPGPTRNPVPAPNIPSILATEASLLATISRVDRGASGIDLDGVGLGSAGAGTGATLTVDGWGVPGRLNARMSRPPRTAPPATAPMRRQEGPWGAKRGVAAGEGGDGGAGALMGR